LSILLEKEIIVLDICIQGDAEERGEIIVFRVEIKRIGVTVATIDSRSQPNSVDPIWVAMLV